MPQDDRLMSNVVEAIREASLTSVPRAFTASHADTVRYMRAREMIAAYRAIQEHDRLHALGQPYIDPATQAQLTAWLAGQAEAAEQAKVNNPIPDPAPVEVKREIPPPQIKTYADGYQDGLADGMRQAIELICHGVQADQPLALIVGCLATRQNELLSSRPLKDAPKNGWRDGDVQRFTRRVDRERDPSAPSEG